MPDLATAGMGRLSSVERPSAECIRNIQFSCQLLQRREGEFIELFFQNLFDDVRWLREMGLSRGRPLCEGFARSVVWAGLSQDSDELIESALRQVGSSYKRQGIPDDWYREFGKSLLYALRHMHPADWGSRLSSDWVAYYMWLSEFIRVGALDARYAAAAPDSRSPAAERASAGGTRIESLDDVFAALRARHFPDSERSLAAVCTRVALRTGIDIRNPRPDQYSDPAALSNVLGTLLAMGYSIRAFSIDAATEEAGRDAPEPSRPAGRRQSSSRSLRRGISRIFGRGV